MNQHEATWHGMMVLTQQGDQRVYFALLKEIRPYVRNILQRQLAQAERVEDVVQEVLLAVHLARDSWRPELAFMPWLHGVIRYKAHDSLRSFYRQQAHEVLDETAYETFAAPATNTGDMTRDMERMLASLTPKQRTLLTLTKVQGLTAVEAAKEMGMTPVAVKVAVHRVIKNLQAMFGGEL